MLEADATVTVVVVAADTTRSDIPMSESFVAAGTSSGMSKGDTGVGA